MPVRVDALAGVRHQHGALRHHRGQISDILIREPTTAIKKGMTV